MSIKLVSEHLNGLKLLQPQVFGDSRGFFLESYKMSDLEKIGISETFLQDNHSCSAKGVLRGLHFQWDKPMGKLIRITKGSALLTEVDLRKKSPSYGQHYQVELSEENNLMLWIPAGFANGFLTLEDDTHVQYKCTAEWNPKAESGILWNDENLGIDWGIINPILSDKDKIAQTFEQWATKDESNSFKLV